MNKRELVKLLKQNGWEIPPEAATTWLQTQTGPV